MVLGGHLIKSWSSTQTSVSLSSSESEFYGVVKAGGVSLGYQALLRDLGLNLPVRVWTDSTATLGICGRQGLGKLRHIDTQCLWIQQRVRDKSIELYKVKGEDNPADLFTKHLASRDRIHRLLELFNCRYADGRAEAAPQMRKELGTSKGENLCQLETPRGWRDPRLCGEAIEEFCGISSLGKAACSRQQLSMGYACPRHSRAGERWRPNEDYRISSRIGSEDSLELWLAKAQATKISKARTR